MSSCLRITEYYSYIVFASIMLEPGRVSSFKCWHNVEHAMKLKNLGVWAGQTTLPDQRLLGLLAPQP
jgi:hypothetical protein